MKKTDQSNQFLSSLDKLESMIDLGLDPLLQAIVDISRELAGAAFAGLSLFNQDNPDVFEYFKVSGWNQPEYLPQGHGLFSLPLHTGQALRVSNITNHPRSVGVPDEHPPIEALLSVPLIHRNRILGCIFLAKPPGSTPFSEQDEELLTDFSASAAMMIDIAKRCQSVKQKAVLEERKRMSQRLHDSVSQTLFALGREVDSLVRSLGDPSNPQAEIHSVTLIRQLAAKGLSEIRAVLFSVSEEFELSKPVNSAFARIIEEFERNSQIKTDLIIRGDLDSVPYPLLQCIYKVIGESLSNVHRHAESSAAVVAITVEQTKIIASIQDIGIGISDIALSNLYSPTSHFGLRSMNKTVEEMGGVFTVLRNDEGGTTIRVQLPLLWRVP
ncbi:GAF domain-containing sensor histidine kinase [Ferviditalea candida]|uniref:histidine kinase n=1 Tax=Ferviditalea candida TaxID=3108399 RepID=A0ABU5ZGM6_9BACL|nr:GAF domain-containing protein [Paenibacillaceae bacterium T2]